MTPLGTEVEADGRSLCDVIGVAIWTVDESGWEDGHNTALTRPGSAADTGEHAWLPLNTTSSDPMWGAPLLCLDVH